VALPNKFGACMKVALEGFAAEKRAAEG